MTYGEVTYSSVRLTYSLVSFERFEAAELLRSNVAAHYGTCGPRHGFVTDDLAESVTEGMLGAAT